MTRRECIIVHAILFVTFLDKLLKPIYLVNYTQLYNSDINFIISTFIFLYYFLCYFLFSFV
ncbi:hypothetical protein ACJX0J_015939, partial [Zea mays]